MVNKINSNIASLHVFYRTLEVFDQYINVILDSLNPTFNSLKPEICSLMIVDKNSSTLIKTPKILSKQFDDQIITQDTLLLSFTFINDQVKKLSKFKITSQILLEVIKKFRKGKFHEC